MKIYLRPEVKSGLGEETFWTWFAKKIPGATFSPIANFNKDTDTILQYSTAQKTEYPQNTICLCWELYPEMKNILKKDIWDTVIDRTVENATRAKKVTVASKFSADYYSQFVKDDISILPIAVDTDLFCPLEKEPIRRKYGLSSSKKIGFWCGTNHEMKGYDQLEKYRQKNPDIDWIVVWKSKEESNITFKAKHFTKVPQHTLAELMNCADFFLSTSRLRPYFMVEYEAMACNLPFIFYDENLEKDFKLSNEPRVDLLNKKWDRNTAKKLWIEAIDTFLSEKSSIYRAKKKKIHETKSLKVSIASLIYQSPSYADSTYNSIHKYTPILKNEGSEFFFVANDPSETVIEHLEKQRYPYYRLDNPFLSETELEELGYAWPAYMNRVYRGYNYAIKKAKNEIVVLINSDMKFSHNWLENLLKHLSKNTFVTSQLVEHSLIRGDVFPGAYNRYFGYSPNSFFEDGFIEFSNDIAKDSVRNGGAYMPCAFFKSNIEKIDYYPEGNLRKDSFHEIRQFGDIEMVTKLKNIGIEHLTAMDSIVYHFNEGEKNEDEQNAFFSRKVNDFNTLPISTKQHSLQKRTMKNKLKMLFQKKKY